MKIAEAIVRHGTAAVLKYGVVAGDNDMPDIFLGGFIAYGLHNDVKMHARVERLYTAIAIEHRHVSRQCHAPFTIDNVFDQ